MIAALLLTIGTCFIVDVERWEEPRPIYRVLEVGQRKYRIAVWTGRKWQEGGGTFGAFEWHIDNGGRVVPCPKS